MLTTTSRVPSRIDLSAIPSVIPNLIGGRDVLPAEGCLFAKIDPATGGEICKVARSTATDVRAAVERARQAQPAWAATTVVKRGEILRHIAILMQEHRGTIADLVALSREAALVVSGDTGPLHIAAAVGAPVVAVFGPTDPQRNGPWSASDVTVSRFESCACHYDRQCSQATWCLDGVTVAEVTAAIQHRLGRAAPGDTGHDG